MRWETEDSAFAPTNYWPIEKRASTIMDPAAHVVAFAYQDAGKARDAAPAAAALAEANARASLAEQRLCDLKAMLDQAKADIDRWRDQADAWRNQAEASQRQLTDQRQASPSLWRCLRSTG